MAREQILLAFVMACCLPFSTTFAQVGELVQTAPATRFRCEGRSMGYYADLELGCRVYHMCDGMGRQFSYTCPNMTLFQQRMLICDHWYMVNCSMAERDYDANLLIGQRDKPFVTDDEMRLRTPRPDVLAAPPFNPYLDITVENDFKHLVHPGNSIVGIADTISDDKNGLDSAKRNHIPHISWYIGNNKRQPDSNIKVSSDADQLKEAASPASVPTWSPAPDLNPNPDISSISPPPRHLQPPDAKIESPATENTNARVTGSDDPVFNFIKRFDPSSPDSHKTAMTKTEIIGLNQHLPAGQASSEDDRTPRKYKNSGNNFNDFQIENDKSFHDQTRFEAVNTKSNGQEAGDNTEAIPGPERVLQPPKADSASVPTSTGGPPVYYEWKWAVPAIDLEPPKLSNATEVDNTTTVRVSFAGRNPFSSVTRSPVTEPDINPSNTEYNISSYFIPDYVFPLDSPHPGYENEDAMTSFQVRVARPGRASYGENPECPQCHPAHLKPGTCEPCIVRR